MVNSAGTVVASYEYDPYGNVTGTGSMANTNPLRYRGYYYDAETEMYLCGSRYYDPAIGRFINADSFASTGQGIIGFNMFAYCGNSPLCYADSSGTRRELIAMSTYDIINVPPVTVPQIADTPAEQTEGVINGQGNLPYSSHSIGWGSYEKSGCGYIAVYNAMQLIGQPQSLQSVTSEIFDIHGSVFYGAGGVGPWSMQSYFDAHDISYTGSHSAEVLTAGISEGSVIVYTIWNKKGNIFKGWHAMTALYTDGSYLVFNRYNNSTSHVEYSALSESYANGAWIYGIRISQ